MYDLTKELMEKKLEAFKDNMSLKNNIAFILKII